MKKTIPKNWKQEGNERIVSQNCQPQNCQVVANPEVDSPEGFLVSKRVCYSGGNMLQNQPTERQQLFTDRTRFYGDYCVIKQECTI